MVSTDDRFVYLASKDTVERGPMTMTQLGATGQVANRSTETKPRRLIARVLDIEDLLTDAELASPPLQASLD